MCLAIPGIIIELDQEAQTAVIDYQGLRKQASTRLVPQAEAGDYALVHAGFIIQLLSGQEGEELAALVREAGLYG